MLPTALCDQFADRLERETLNQLESERIALSERSVPSLDLAAAEVFGERQHVREAALVYRQILLHRASALFDGAILAASHENPYSLALCVRGHFETTAALGYLCKRLRSAKQGSISPATVDKDVTDLILGSRDTTLKGAGAPEAKQIMSLLDQADEYVEKVIMPEARGKTMLRESYEALCEQAHPNFHSNATSFDLDPPGRQALFRWKTPMRPVDARILEYLLIVNPIFVVLFDSAGEWRL